jgi:hypothetical protein
MSYDITSLLPELSKILPLSDHFVPTEAIDKLTQEQRKKWIEECNQIHENMEMSLCDRTITQEKSYLDRFDWAVRLTIRFTEITLGINYDTKLDEVEIGSVSYGRYMELLFV